MDLINIIEYGKKIGFSSDLHSTTYYFPCKIKLKDKKELDFVTVCFCPLLNEWNQVEINDIIKIKQSKYALDKKLRDSSLKAQDFKGDRPFFLQTLNGKILGYNAIDIVDFTFHDKIKSKDIKIEVDFDTARMEGFEMIKNHREFGMTVKIKLTEEIKELIKK